MCTRRSCLNERRPFFPPSVARADGTYQCRLADTTRAKNDELVFPHGGDVLCLSEEIPFFPLLSLALFSAPRRTQCTNTFEMDARAKIKGRDAKGAWRAEEAEEQRCGRGGESARRRAKGGGRRAEESARRRAAEEEGGRGRRT